jgi:hypothetical protein
VCIREQGACPPDRGLLLAVGTGVKIAGAVRRAVLCVGQLRVVRAEVEVNKWGEAARAVSTVKAASPRDKRGLDRHWSRRAVVTQYGHSLRRVRFVLAMGCLMSSQTGKRRPE